MKLNSLKKNWMKHLLQWGVLITIILFLTKLFGNETADPEAYCPMGGLETLATYLVRGSMACSMTMVQIMMGTALAVGVILFGKLFCSYLCPLGLVNELFYRLRRKLKIKSFRIERGTILDKILRIVKYALVFVIFYNTLNASELFCKNFDPYYAFATGFKGEITVWMTIISVSILFLGSLLVDMFWCKYICPLGAISNIFKFTLWFVALVLVFAILTLVGVNVSWVILLAALCITGYLLEILCKNPKYNPQIVSVYRNTEVCNGCGICEKKCPHHVNITSVAKVTNVDCTLCGECVASCNKGALTITKKKWGKYIPFVVVILLFAGALWMGSTTELPTIDVQWDMEKVEGKKLETIKVEGLTSVRCYGSSMAFKGKLQRIYGTHGVKMFVKSHTAMVTFDPSVLKEDDLRKAIFTPTRFKVNTPEKDVKDVKVITFRAEGLHDRMDANYLGMQFRQTGRKIYGLETEYACPIIVRLFINPSETLSEEFLQEIVEKETLEFPTHGGGEPKIIECNFEFAHLEEGESTIAVREYLEKMFEVFSTNFKKKDANIDESKIGTIEFANQKYDLPIIRRNLPYLSNWLSQQKGLYSIKMVLNEENTPAIRISYIKKEISPKEILEIINTPVWKIKYQDGSIKDTDAKLSIKQEPKIVK